MTNDTSDGVYHVVPCYALYIPEKLGSCQIGSGKFLKPGPGEVLIKEKEKYPTTSGYEGAGDIEAAGEGVTNYKKGDKASLQAFVGVSKHVRSLGISNASIGLY